MCHPMTGVGFIHCFDFQENEFPKTIGCVQDIEIVYMYGYIYGYIV